MSSVKSFIFLEQFGHSDVMLILLQLPQCLLDTLAEEPGGASPLGGLHSAGEKGAVGGAGQVQGGQERDHEGAGGCCWGYRPDWHYRG